LKGERRTRFKSQVDGLRHVFKLLLWFLIFPISCGIKASEPKTALIPLTDQERSWLEAHPVLRVAPDPDFPPIEFYDENGQFSGVMKDYLQLIERKIGARFDIIRLRNWDDVIEKARNREVDILSAATPTPARLEFLDFTRGILEFPSVIIMKEDFSLSKINDRLAGLHIVVVSNYSSYEFAKNAYPDANVEGIPDIVSGLRMVSFGQADAMILNISAASYYLEKEGITNLKIYKEIDDFFELAIASRNDWPMLNRILDKAVASITQEEKQAVRDKWVTIQNPGWRITTEFILIMAMMIILMIVFTVLMMNRRLKKLVEVRTLELQNELKERIKAEKEKEALQQAVSRAKKMEALGLLAGGVAHDLNNILSGILSYPDLLLSDLPEDSRLKRPLEIIRDTGYRAKAIVSDLLTVARGVASEKKVLNLNKLLVKYLESNEFKELAARFERITVVSQPDFKLGPIEASEVHLKKMIHNLVLNALEAFEMGAKGSIWLSTGHEQVEKPLKGYRDIVRGTYAVLRVKDNGPGISDVDIDRIFEPFYSKKIMGRSGTGLGLAIVWNAMQDHDGYVTVESSDKGTCFSMYFPVSGGFKTETADEPTDITALLGQGQTILIVDDEPIQREILKDLLSRMNYVPHAVESGEAALEYLSHHDAELVILDMVMDPGMNGKETYSRILEKNPNQKAIIASGYSQTEDVEATLALGAGAFIEKPYNLKTIATAIKSGLDKAE